jgi:signal transduction histidine kinase
MACPQPQTSYAAGEIADEIRMAAHELLEPLVQAEAYAALIHDRLAVGDRRHSAEDLEILSRGLARARIVVEALLYDAMACDRELPLRPVDLARLVDDCVEQLEPEIRAHEATLRIDDLPVVRGDEALLGALFRNLLANALKHGPRHGGTIDLHAKRQRARWRVSIASEGPAIPAEERAEIFLPYRRGNRARRTSGAGLGLAVCRRIVERHGGTIRVATGASGCNVFFFTLPI